MKILPLFGGLLLCSAPPVQADSLSELCRDSSLGQVICEQRLQTFYLQQPEGPLSDEDFAGIYGCINDAQQKLRTETFEVNTCE